MTDAPVDAPVDVPVDAPVDAPAQRGAPEPDPTVRLALPPDLEATLVLVRHGQSTWLAEGRFQGQADPPLTPLGRRQARLAGERIAAATRPPRLPIPAGRPIAIFHSPLARTRETADAIASALGGPEAADAPPLVPDGRLAEIAQGAWEGLLQTEIESRYAAVIDGWRRDPVTVHAPGGETLASVDARVRVGLERILGDLAAAAGGSVGGGGPAPGRAPARSFYDLHQAPWAVIVSHGGALQVVMLALLGLALDRFWSFPMGPAALAIVDVRNGRAAVRAWNRTDHLAPIEEEDAQAARAASEQSDQSRTGAL